MHYVRSNFGIVFFFVSIFSLCVFLFPLRIRRFLWLFYCLAKKRKYYKCAFLLSFLIRQIIGTNFIERWKKRNNQQASQNTQSHTSEMKYEMRWKKKT